MLLCIITPNFWPIIDILKELCLPAYLCHAYDGKISKFQGTRKNWPSMAILNSDLLLGTVHHSIISQADIWYSKRVMSFGTDRVRDAGTEGQTDAWIDKNNRAAAESNDNIGT